MFFFESEKVSNEEREKKREGKTKTGLTENEETLSLGVIMSHSERAQRSSSAVLKIAVFLMRRHPFWAGNQTFIQTERDYQQQQWLLNTSW